jgi:phospho-N-acetylmuramoyl-pentapeptide-transferase
MLPYLSSYLLELWGPFRLFASYLVLLSLGAFVGALATWYLLPRYWRFLPRDQGKPFVKDSEEAKGKPTGAGVILATICLLLWILLMPGNWRLWGMGGCLYLIMLAGFGDDCSEQPWSEMKKGLLDLLVCLLAALIYCRGEGMVIWLPLIKGSAAGGGFLLPPWLYVPGAAFLLLLSINAVNCSDGVDGLAGSLAMLALFVMGAFLYAVTGHVDIAKYLLLPHYADGARWAILIACVAGCLGGYLWHNAKPSVVLMGDAGSRFLGLLLGMTALASGNPVLILVAAPILLVNGGTGLVKLLLLRMLKRMGFDVRQPLRNVVNPQKPENFASDEEVKQQLGLVRLAHRVRFPLHDHCRKNRRWSDEQVLLRFMLMQGFLTPLLILLIVKLR